MKTVLYSLFDAVRRLELKTKSRLTDKEARELERLTAWAKRKADADAEEEAREKIGDTE